MPMDGMAGMEAAPEEGQSAVYRGTENFRKAFWMVILLIIAAIVAFFVIF